MSYHTYILTNKNRRVIYIGSTTSIERRMREHKMKTYPFSFTAIYNVDRLVYLEPFDTLRKARSREYQLKKRSRSYKLELIDAFNPAWIDLSSEWDR